MTIKKLDATSVEETNTEKIVHTREDIEANITRLEEKLKIWKDAKKLLN